MNDSFSEQLEELRQENNRLKQELEFSNKYMENSNYWETYRNKKGEIIYISPNLKKILGERKEDYINGNIPFTEFIHKDDIEKTSNNYKKVMQGIDVPPHKCRLTNNLSAEHILIDYKRVVKKDGQLDGIRTCISNITEAENEIIYHRNLLQSITDQIPAFIALVDRNFKFIHVNNYYSQIETNDCEKFIGKKIHETIGKDCFEKHLPACQKALNGESVNYETTYKNQTEFIFRVNLIPHYSNSEIDGVLIYCFDITESRKAEETLTENENKFKGVFNQSHVGTAIVGLDKKFITCNTAFCQLIGYHVEEIQGKTISDITYPEDRAIGMSDMKSIINGETEYSVVQKRYLHKNGFVLWGELSISIVRDKEFKPLYFIAVIQDITERLEAVKALKESETQLRNLNATKDKLFSIIAHDLRSPFNNIIGASSLLSDNETVTDTTKSKKYTEIINSTAKTTLTLLDNLLNWSKAQTGKLEKNPQKINLSLLLESVKANLNVQASVKNITIRILHPEVPEIYTDKNMVSLILRNLITNAIKFTKPGGEIEVAVAEKINTIEVSVADNGIGIPEDKLKELFTIHSDSHSVGTANEQGSGLGLILCKEFVEILGGKIWAISTEGKGSEFKFTIPPLL